MVGQSKIAATIFFGSFIFVLSITSNLVLAIFGGLGLTLALCGTAIFVCERLAANQEKRDALLQSASPLRPLRPFRPDGLFDSKEAK